MRTELRKAANELRELRVELGMSQAQFGHMVGCSGGCVCHYETYRIEWPDHNLTEIRKTITKFLTERYANDLECVSRLTFEEPAPEIEQPLEPSPEGVETIAKAFGLIP